MYLDLIKIKNCALFGGTFDPFHNGHLHLIKSLVSTNRFERFVVVPAGDPYQKASPVSAKDRFAMTALALHGEAVTVSDCEIRRTGPSYAIDTVEEIARIFPAERYTWILGSDAFAGIQEWHRFEELAKMVDFLVVTRPGAEKVKDIPGVRFEIVEIGAPDISSTDLRSRIGKGEEVSSLIPDAVIDYIKGNGLYGAA